MASSGSSSDSSSCQTGSSTPWPAVRSSSASCARIVAQAAGALLPRSATSDWSANSGWRSQTPTTSSIGAASIQAARRSSASARALRAAGLVDAGRGPTVTSAGVAGRIAQGGPQREPAAQRVARQHAPLPRRGDLPQPALERVLAVVEQGARIAFGQELRDGPPGVPTLHEARDEEHHRSPMIPINRTYAPLQAFVDELARCGMRHAVTCPGSRNAPLVAQPRRAGGDRGGLGDRRARGRVRGARDGQGERAAGGHHLHLGDRGRQPASGRRRGVGGARAAARAHRRPSAGAARGGRRAGDRPAAALRQRRQVVRGGGHARAGPRRRRSTTARSPAAPGGPPRAAGRGPCT